MADSFDMDAAFGNPKKQQASTGNQPAGEQKPGKIDMDAAFGKSAPSSVSSNKTVPAEDQEYEAKVQSLMPRAQEHIKSKIPYGETIGAFAHGASNVPVIGPALGAANRAVSAAAGRGAGSNFSERYQQLRAEDEAISRAYSKAHPVATTAGELASGIATVALAPESLLISGPLEAAAVARGVGPTAAKLAGVGAEGAAWGAGTAAGEQAFGTQSKKDEPGIANSALIGGGAGVGLTLAGKGISAAASGLSDTSVGTFAKNLFGGEKRLADKVTSMIDESKIPDFIKAKEEGKPVTLFSIVDPSRHAELEKIFEGRPEAAKILQDKLGTWLGDGQADLRNFANTLLSTKASPAEMQATAMGLAKQRVTSAYEAAKREGNGAGSWKPEWDKWLNSNTFTDALDKTIADMRERTALRRGDPDLYESPFIKGEAAQTKTSSDDAREFAESHFKNKGVEPPAGIEHLGEGAPTGRYQLVNPAAVDIDFLDTLQRNLNRASESRMNIKNTPSGDVGAEIANARQQIMDSLTDPKSRLYNKEYAEALRAQKNSERTEDAFTYGRKILTNATNAEKSSAIASEVANMSPREKYYVAHGVLEEVIARASNPDGTVKIGVLNNLLNEGGYTKKTIQAALGERRFGELERHIRTQATLSNAIVAADKFGRGQNFNYDYYRAIRVAGAYLIHDWAALAGLAYNWGEQYANSKFAKNIATKLASDDLNAFKNGLSLIEKDPTALRSFGEFIRENAPSIIGTMAGRSTGGAVHMNSGGAVHMSDGGVPPRTLDERGMYSEGAETARKILPKAQGSGPEFIQRLLGKGVRQDELHHTRIGGIPLRHMETGELHPAVQGQIGGHELADLIHKNAPQMNRIIRNEESNEYRPAYDMFSQKLPASQSYSEMNVAKPVSSGQDVFSPPAEDYSVIPQHVGYEAYPRQSAAHPRNTVLMPIDDLSARFFPHWDQGSRSANRYGRVHDRFGHYMGLLKINPGISGENFEENRPALRQSAQGIASDRLKKKLSPTMGHFTDVPNLAYHSRMSDVPLQKDGKQVKNLNIEEAQSDAARRYDTNKRENRPPDRFAYDPKVHQKKYEEAVAAQERLRTSSEPFIKKAEDYKAIQDYEDYFDNLTYTNDTVPDVPHLESNKSWQRALAKDVLHHAAKQGYESVTVTPWQEIVRRARHSTPVDQLEIQGLGKPHSNIPSWDNLEPEQFHVKGLPIPLTMDDLKKVYGNEIELRVRKILPEGKRGSVSLRDDSNAKNPFYAFVPHHEEVDPEDENSVQQFLAEVIDSGKSTRRKAEVHNAFIKQLQNVINEEHDPHFKIDYEHSKKHTDRPLESGHERGQKIVAPGAFLSPELRESILKKGFKRFKKGGYVTDNLTKPVDPAKGYAFGGSANQMRMVNKSVHMPKPGDEDFVGPTMTNSSYDPNKSGVFDKLNMFGERNIHWTPDLGHAASRGYRVDKKGRTMRSTGGRIPEADKLFKQAKKYVDNHTKHLLDVPDDAIVKALRVAQKKV
jgi:hypothetical protein